MGITAYFSETCAGGRNKRSYYAGEDSPDTDQTKSSQCDGEGCARLMMRLPQILSKFWHLLGIQCRPMTKVASVSALLGTRGSIFADCR